MWPPLCGQFLGEKDDFIGADWFSAFERNQVDFSKPNGNVIKDFFFFFGNVQYFIVLPLEFLSLGKVVQHDETMD